MAPVEREIRRDIESKQLWALEVFQHEIVGCLGRFATVYRSRFLGHTRGTSPIAPPPSIVDPDVTGRWRAIGHAAIAARRAATGV